MKRSLASLDDADHEEKMLDQTTQPAKRQKMSKSEEIAESTTILVQLRGSIENTDNDEKHYKYTVSRDLLINNSPIFKSLLMDPTTKQVTMNDIEHNVFEFILDCLQNPHSDTTDSKDDTKNNNDKTTTDNTNENKSNNSIFSQLRKDNVFDYLLVCDKYCIDISIRQCIKFIRAKWIVDKESLFDFLIKASKFDELIDHETFHNYFLHILNDNNILKRYACEFYINEDNFQFELAKKLSLSMMIALLRCNSFYLHETHIWNFCHEYCQSRKYFSICDLCGHFQSTDKLLTCTDCQYNICKNLKCLEKLKLRRNKINIDDKSESYYEAKCFHNHKLTRKTITPKERIWDSADCRVCKHKSNFDEPDDSWYYCDIMDEENEDLDCFYYICDNCYIQHCDIIKCQFKNINNNDKKPNHVLTNLISFNVNDKIKEKNENKNENNENKENKEDLENVHEQNNNTCKNSKEKVLNTNENQFDLQCTIEGCKYEYRHRACAECCKCYCHDCEDSDGMYGCGCGEFICIDCYEKAKITHNSPLFTYVMKKLTPHIKLNNIDSQYFATNIMNVLVSCNILDTGTIAIGRNSNDRFDFGTNYLDLNKDIIQKNDIVDIYIHGDGFECYQINSIDKNKNIVNVSPIDETGSKNISVLDDLIIAKGGSISMSENSRFYNKNKLDGWRPCRWDLNRQINTLKCKCLGFGLSVRDDDKWFHGCVSEYNIQSGQARIAIDKSMCNKDTWNYYAHQLSSKDNEKTSISTFVPQKWSMCGFEKNGWIVPINDPKLLSSTFC